MTSLDRARQLCGEAHTRGMFNLGAMSAHGQWFFGAIAQEIDRAVAETERVRKIGQAETERLTNIIRQNAKDWDALRAENEELRRKVMEREA